MKDPLPDLPKFLRNRYLGLGTRHGDERRIILKLKTCTVILREPLLKFLAFSENEPLPYRPIFSETDNWVLEHATEMR